MSDTGQKKKKTVKEVIGNVGKKTKQGVEDVYVNGQAVDFIAQQTGKLLATLLHDPIYLVKEDLKQLALYCDARYKIHTEALKNTINTNESDIDILQKLDELKTATTNYGNIVEDIERFIDRNKNNPEYQEIISTLSDETGTLKENIRVQIERLEESKERFNEKTTEENVDIENQESSFDELELS